VRGFLWRLARVTRNLSPARHPLIAVGVISVAGATAAFLVIIVLVTALARAPAQLGHAYESYFNNTGQLFWQACEQAHGPDCRQFWGP
jgi:hypothetical protein